VLLAGRTDEARALVEQLRGLGHAAVVIDDALITESALAGVVRALQIAGVTAISARQSLSQETLRALREVVGDAFFANSQAATAWLGRQA
jgi:bifunctional enzyme CysN/CysC/sulfate adenylyltransferase subunit 1